MVTISTVYKNYIVLLCPLVGSYDQDPRGNTIKEININGKYINFITGIA